MTPFCFAQLKGYAGSVYAKHAVSGIPWGGRHVILLGDPAQLPAVSRSDILGTRLWHSFSILVLRESKRCTVSVLSKVLAKVRLGERQLKY